jgi:hypothetical protein
MSDWSFEIYDPSGSPFRDRYQVSEGDGFRGLEDEDVLDRFGQTIEDEYHRPLLDQIRAASEEKKAELREEFNRGRVHRWITGENYPSDKNVPKIKQILGIQDGELPEPDPQQVRDVAAVETLKFIRACRRPAADPPQIAMNNDMYRVLAFVFGNLADCFGGPGKNRDDALSRLAITLQSKFPKGGIRVKGDIDALLKDWVGPMVILIDAIDNGRDI